MGGRVLLSPTAEIANPNRRLQMKKGLRDLIVQRLSKPTLTAPVF
jgi:hypothetical protein